MREVWYFLQGWVVMFCLYVSGDRAFIDLLSNIALFKPLSDIFVNEAIVCRSRSILFVLAKSSFQCRICDGALSIIWFFG